MHTGFSIAFYSLAALSVIRFIADRALWHLPMCVAWIAFGLNVRAHAEIWKITFFVAVVLGLVLKWQRDARVKKAAQASNLRPLSNEEEEFRSTLSSEERHLVEGMEKLFGKRKSIEEIRAGQLHREQAAAQETTRLAAKQAEAEAVQAEDAEMSETGPVTAREVRFRLASEATFQTPEGLRIVPPGDYSGMLELQAENDAEASGEPFVKCTFSFSEGPIRWSGQTFCRIETMHSVETREGGSGAILWADAPADWKDAIRAGCLIANVPAMDDCRREFEIRIAGQTHSVFAKYMPLKVTMAIMDAGRCILIRIHQLQAMDEHDVFRKLPPFCVKLPIEKILPLTNPSVHFLWNDESEEEDEGPIRFERI